MTKEKPVSRNTLRLVALATGFSLMTFELAAARVLAPTIGSSTYVWTSVIGVIIAALSFGYFIGGKVADARHRSTDVAWLCLLAALTVGCVIQLYPSFLASVAQLGIDRRWQGLIASLVLFAPFSFLLGVVSPYLAKLAVRSLATSGRSIASLSALNSIGGIIGTFATGFVLFSYIGSRETFVVVGVLLLVISWALLPRHNLQWRIVASGAVLLLLFLWAGQSNAIAIDTPSAHYQIREGKLYSDRPTIRYLQSGPGGAQSGIFTDGSRELPFWYTRELAGIVARAPQKQNILILGGGTFTLPQYLADQYPRSQIDVVEIDAGLEAIATTYFQFRHPDNVQLIFDDARAYLGSSSKQYDVIIVDVYSDISIPFSLMTAEYGQAVAEALAPNGTLAVNAIAAETGPCRALLAAIDAPYRRYLPTSSYRVSPRAVPTQRTNIILVYARSGRSLPYDPLVLPGRPLYTDNFMPAERLQAACL